MATTNSTYTSPEWRFYKYPSSISPIPELQRHGMIVLCAIALMSCITTLTVLGYLSYRFFIGRHEHGTPLHKNQYMLLIYSLVLADFQLNLGFLLDLTWLEKMEILAPTAGCNAQGWLINVGDLSSGFFIFAIACHTFFTVVYGRKISLRIVCCSIVSFWILAVVLIMTPLILHPSDIFVAGGSWCSLNAKYNTLRLWSHYIWDLIALFAVIVMYATTFIVLRKRMGEILPDLAHQNVAALENGNTRNSTRSRVRSLSRATWYMVLYPLIYVLSTLPLNVGRMSSLTGHNPSATYLVVAGNLLACGGWMNSLVYSLTRRIFHTRKSGGDQDPNQNPLRRGRDSTSIRGVDISLIEHQNSAASRELQTPVRSMDKVVDVGKSVDHTSSSDTNEGVTMERAWEIRTEEARPNAEASKSHGLGYQISVSY